MKPKTYPSRVVDNTHHYNGPLLRAFNTPRRVTTLRGPRAADRRDMLEFDQQQSPGVGVGVIAGLILILILAPAFAWGVVNLIF